MSFLIVLLIVGIKWPPIKVPDSFQYQQKFKDIAQNRNQNELEPQKVCVLIFRVPDLSIADEP